MALTAILSAILKNEVDHRARGVLELLCKNNLVQKTQNWRSSPSRSVRSDTQTDADLDLWGQTHGHSVLSILGLWRLCLPKFVSKEAKLAKQDGDDVSDRHTHTQTDKREKSLPNNGLEDLILVVNHCVEIMYHKCYCIISAQLRCAEDPHSVQYSHAQVIASADVSEILLHHNFCASGYCISIHMHRLLHQQNYCIIIFDKWPQRPYYRRSWPSRPWRVRVAV